MRRRTVLSAWTHKVDEQLPVIHALLREGKEADAAAMFASCIGGHIQSFYVEEMRREAKFLKVIDASTAIGAGASNQDLTPRQAMIAAAMAGRLGDDFSSWNSPMDRSSLLDWAESHYQGPQEHLEVALRALLAEGLFFEVHPGVFAEPCYFCSYEPSFLEELPGGDQHAEAWEKFRRVNSKHHPDWVSVGLCHGHGSESSGSDIGCCLGTSCCCFAGYGDKSCTHELAFNPVLLQLVAQRREPYDTR